MSNCQSSLELGIIVGCSCHLATIRLMSKHGLIQLNQLEQERQLESTPWTGWVSHNLQTKPFTGHPYPLQYQR